MYGKKFKLPKNRKPAELLLQKIVIMKTVLAELIVNSKETIDEDAISETLKNKEAFYEPAYSLAIKDLEDVLDMEAE